MVTPLWFTTQASWRMVQCYNTTANCDPLQFTIGEGQIIPRFERAVIGLEPGESKTIKVPADEAYGPHREELVVVIDQSHIPVDTESEVGQQFQIRQPDSQTVVVTVTDVTESRVTLDANHPLAGEDLIL